MADSRIYRILTLYGLIYLFSCSQPIDEEEKIDKQIIDYYTTVYGFVNEPLYQPIFDEFYNDTVYRYYWELVDNAVDSHLDKFFSPFDSESLAISDIGIMYRHFGVIFHRGGKILHSGFFDDSLRFSGITYDYYFDEGLVSKNMYKLDNKFYEVFYELDHDGNIIDSSYKYFPIVHSDVDTFEGPFLNICLDVHLIINTTKYSFKDFQLFYTFYDTRHHEDIKLIDGQKDRILENLSRETSDGYYFFCHDLKVKNHLMMAFGVMVDPGISDQDLSIGTYHGPVFNKNKRN